MRIRKTTRSVFYWLAVSLGTAFAFWVLLL